MQEHHVARLGDNCGHVYLDIGSNVGVQVRKLFEPQRYPGAPVLQLFEQLFGDVRARRANVCAFGFEALPSHAPRLRQVESCHRRQGWRTQFIFRAVSNVHNETVAFHGGGGGGSTLALQQASDQGRLSTTSVQTLDLYHWLGWHVFARRLPAGFGHAAGETRPVVAAKMDIEGSEFTVLPRLVLHSALCRGKIDFMYVEEHFWRGFALPARYKTSAMPHGMSVHAAQELLRLDPNCQVTGFLSLDDESYGSDHGEGESPEARVACPADGESDSEATARARSAPRDLRGARTSPRAPSRAGRRLGRCGSQSRPRPNAARRTSLAAGG